MDIIRAKMLALFLILPCFPVIAGDYYVSPNGSSGSGSINDPWSLDYANKQLRAGDRAILRGGIYRTQIAPLNSGSAEGQRIVYQAHSGEEPTIDLGKPIEGKWLKYGGTDGVDAVLVDVSHRMSLKLLVPMLFYGIGKLFRRDMCRQLLILICYGLQNFFIVTGIPM